MPAKFSGRPEWNAGEWLKLPDIFSGSPEMLPTTSDMLAGCTVMVPILSGVLAGSSRRASKPSDMFPASRPEPPESSYVFSGCPEVGPTTPDLFSGSPDDPSKRGNPLKDCNLLTGDGQGASSFFPPKHVPRKHLNHWDDARRVVSYRVIITAVAGGAELKNEIVHDASEVTFNDLPPGQVKITIAARNSKGGESAPSAPVTATVP